MAATVPGSFAGGPVQAPLTWTAPAGNSSNAIALSIVNGSYEVSDNNKIVASQPVNTTSSVTLTGAANSKDTFNILNTAPAVPTTVNLESSADQVAWDNGFGVQGIQGR